MLTPRQQQCLRGMGIRLWQPRTSAEKRQQASSPTVDNSPPADAPAQTPVATRVVVTSRAPAPAQPDDLSGWDNTLQAIEACSQCELAHSCTRKVPGKGSQQADLMIIGEAPGHEEDRQGKPFVGRAGQLLDRMLQAIELDPAQVYITNILKCRPPNNRDPKPVEVTACARFLQAQIKMVNPRVIFSVGRISAQNLLLDASPVGRLRGRQFTLPQTDIPLLVTYHPAYLLRNPAEKAKVWQDLKSLRAVLNG